MVREITRNTEVVLECRLVLCDLRADSPKELKATAHLPALTKSP